jgi:DNA-binding CsgD family transcriptional regulator
MDDMLHERDWEFLLDTIYRINTADGLPAYAQEALACICTLIPCDQGTFFSLDNDGSFCPNETYVYGKEAHYLREFMAGGYMDELIFRIMNVKMYSNVLRDTDVIPDYIRLNSRVFKEIYIPQGIYYALRLILYSQGKVIGQFALFNSKERGDFTDRDLRLGNLVIQHLALKLKDIKAEKQQHAQADSLDMLRITYKLTQRELQVVLMIADGMSEGEVAERLFISLSTIKKHLYNAYSKIGVNNRVQLLQVVLSK